jgi:thiol-disulfide isomerase/thioredoxin
MQSNIRFIKILLIVAVLFMLPALSAHAQTEISGTIRSYTARKLMLSLIKGDAQLAVDSTVTDRKGNFVFSMDSDAIPGMYVLSTDEKQSIRIIFDRQSVSLYSDGFGDEDVVRFTGSDDNTAWYDYYLLKSNNRFLQELIKPLLQQYPDNLVFYQQALAEYARLQTEVHDKAAVIINKNSNDLASRFIKADLSPVTDPGLPFDEQRALLIRDFFKSVDFQDTALIYSDILTRKVIDYLSMHQRQGMSLNEAQLAFMQGIDRVLGLASESDKMYVFVLDYLLRGFSGMGFGMVTDFLATLPRLDRSCMEPALFQQLEASVAPFRKVKNGAPAPDIISVDLSGNPFVLSKQQPAKSVVLFWSVSCPHCLSMLPGLKQLADEFQLRVISVVIGSETSALNSLIAEHKLNWIHLMDGKGWEGQAVKDYAIYATPTLYLLDEKNHITGKPFDLEELREML